VADERLLSSGTPFLSQHEKSKTKFHHQHRHQMHHPLQWHSVPFPAQDLIQHILSSLIVDDSFSDRSLANIRNQRSISTLVPVGNRDVLHMKQRVDLSNDSKFYLFDTACCSSLLHCPTNTLTYFPGSSTDSTHSS
jgi:hypothetical protein